MKQRYRLLALVVCATLCLGLIAPTAAYANDGDQTCTSFKDRYASMSDGKAGILTNITKFIKEVIGEASKNLFKAFTDSSIYQNVVNAAIPLMIVLYGVGFLIGIVQANFMQVLIRLIKVGLIYILISPSGWDVFNSYVVHFFNDGTDQIIGKVISIGTGTDMGDMSKPDWSPFTQLDGLGKVILSPEFVIAVVGSTLNGGPYGLMMGSLLGFAMVGLIKLFIHALKLYATAFVVRSLLIGIAPIFIVFLLFDRTKQLFTGWVNVMVAMTLQPILYFTFISFFIVMMTTATKNMMGGNELCWSEFSATSGTQNKLSFWRFKGPKGDISVDTDTWSGPVSCLLNGGKDSDGNPCPPFPINIVDILSFLILIYVAGKFGGVVEQISNEISNSYVNLDTGGKMSLDAAKKDPDGKGAGSGVNPREPNTKAQVTNPNPVGKR